MISEKYLSVLHCFSGTRKMKRLALLFMYLLFVCVPGYARSHYYIVSKDGTGNFKSVQQALNAIPENNQTPDTVFIKNGIYREKLHLDHSKDFVTLMGENRFKTILTFDDHSGKVSPSGDTIRTKTSYSFLIEANNFTAKNLTFRNDAGINAGQAVAVDVNGDKAAFINCRFIGNQDVLLTDSRSSREYYKDCYIEGTTDFIFGFATAWFEHCHIQSKKNSHVTAAATPQDHPFGYVFYDCVLTGTPDVTAADLGRPWRPYANVAFIHCYLGQDIKPEGWSNWHHTNSYETARYAEYENYGPGADTSARVSWSHQLTDDEVRKYTIENVLGKWMPPGYRCN